MVCNYDLVVIGSGVAASVAAQRCRSAGWRVAVVDQRPFGGTCALRGCDPKKVLVGVAEAVDLAGRLRDDGVRAAALDVDWPALMTFKRSFTDPVPRERMEQLAAQGIDALQGAARFTERTSVAVDGDTLTARRVLIATGAEPRRLDIPGEEHVVTSDVFLELERLPERLLLIGGGYIAFELAHIARRAGAAVTVLQRGPSVLGRFDQDLVRPLLRKSRAMGIEIETGTAVEAVEASGAGFIVRAAGEGAATSYEADLVVHAAGRVPALEALELEAAGVAHEHGRLLLNEFLQSTSNPAVYAAGDAAQLGPPLTPVANRDGRIAAANMLEGNHVPADHGPVPSVLYTIPPLASVGLSEDEARQRGLRFRVHHEEVGDWYNNRRVNEDTAAYKMLVDKESDRILGAHVLGTHADELINVLALAMRFGLSAAAISETTFAYPTAASDLSHMLS